MASAAGATMLAVTFAGKGRTEVRRVPKPRIEAATDAVVRVTMAGICGSDLHPYHEREKGLDVGTVMGHEFVGEVVEVGPACTRTRVGDVVFGPFSTCCNNVVPAAAAAGASNAGTGAARRDAKLRRLFAQFDQDVHDGSISATELARVLRETLTLGQYARADVKRMMAVADADENGTIEFGEFRALFADLTDDELTLEACAEYWLLGQGSAAGGAAATALSPGSPTGGGSGSGSGSGSSSSAGRVGSDGVDCFYCSRGLPCRCPRGQLFGWVEKGVGLQGCQAEYVRVPLADGTLCKLPPRVTPEEALLLGDILSTGFFCAHNAGVGSLESLSARGGASARSAAASTESDAPARVFAVVGCGPVGLMTIIGSKELANPSDVVYAIDRVPERLAMAQRLGAVPLNFESDDVAAVIRAATGGRGADAVMEVVGLPSATELAYDVVRPGGVLSSVGVHTEKHLTFSPGDVYDKNLTYKSGRCPARWVMDFVIPVVQSRRWPLSDVFSHRLPLAEGPHGYELFDKKLDGCTKCVLVAGAGESKL